MLQGCIQRIVDGANTSIWFDKWLPGSNATLSLYSGPAPQVNKVCDLCASSR